MQTTSLIKITLVGRPVLITAHVPTISLKKMLMVQQYIISILSILAVYFTQSHRNVTWPQLAVLIKSGFNGRAKWGVAEGSLAHEMRQDIHWQGEDDGGVLLRCDGVEGLQVAKLQGWRGLCDHEGRLLQGTRCVHLTFCCNHLYVDQEREKLV